MQFLAVSFRKSDVFVIFQNAVHSFEVARKRAGREDSDAWREQGNRGIGRLIGMRVVLKSALESIERADEIVKDAARGEVVEAGEWLLEVERDISILESVAG